MCRVLIIEDDALAAADIQQTLAAAGATAFEFAATEGEAVRLGVDTCPEFITSDVMLERGSGPAAVERILRACGPIPVIFITATPDQCEGCEAVVLEKPFHAGQLAEAFRAIAPLA